MNVVLRIAILTASVFVVLIPKRYRRWWPVEEESLRAPAIVSGVIEWLAGAPGAVLYVAVGLETAKQGLGVAGFVLNPFFPFVFMFIEGLVRGLAAIASAQVLPTLPLQVAAWLHDYLDAQTTERELGPIFVDKVERGDGQGFDLKIWSSRPKPHWNSYMTIRFEKKFYQMFKEEQAPGPRKFTYLLRLSPEWRHVVVVYEYRPDDVLQPGKAPVRWSPQK